MARKVFFSFHFERDIWRVGQVRNSWLTKPDRNSAGFWDKAKYEEVKKKGVNAIKKWIDDSIYGTSVTVVLIGKETSTREWVKYEIQKSYREGNGILGIHIHNIRNVLGQTDTKGSTTFGKIANDKYFFELFPTYDWVNDNGYINIGKWVEEAAKKAGR
ncbi:MAG: TIR domain-containing protein [Candidatus Roizmanbacteria bacterium]|nr:TIR domain-containing protein [Candidatus Roizmanbacteria bacterium]